MLGVYDSMKKLISQLLEITRMQQNNGQISFEKEDFSMLVNAVCDDAESVDKKSITLIRDIESGVEMDMEILLMSRLVTNLLSNAYNYTKDGGTVRVSLKKDAGKIRLEIADNGIGIAKEHIDKIWNRFYRVDKARCREEGCSGLGLPMVKEIAVLHGAEVLIESTEGQGSTFIVEF